MPRPIDEILENYRAIAKQARNNSNFDVFITVDDLDVLIAAAAVNATIRERLHNLDQRLVALETATTTQPQPALLLLDVVHGVVSGRDGPTTLCGLVVTNQERDMRTGRVLGIVQIDGKPVEVAVTRERLEITCAGCKAETS